MIFWEDAGFSIRFLICHISMTACFLSRFYFACRVYFYAAERHSFARRARILFYRPDVDAFELFARPSHAGQYNHTFRVTFRSFVWRFENIPCCYRLPRQSSKWKVESLSLISLLQNLTLCRYRLSLRIHRWLPSLILPEPAECAIMSWHFGLAFHAPRRILHASIAFPNSLAELSFTSYTYYLWGTALFSQNTCATLHWYQLNSRFTYTTIRLHWHLRSFLFLS